MQSVPAPTPGYDNVSQSLSMLPQTLGAPLDPSSDWVARAAALTNNGEPVDYEEVGEYAANVAITHAYTIHPWADKTHEYIQQGMIVFLSRYVNQRFRMHNMAPVWKLNIEQRLHYFKANNPYEDGADASMQEFQRMLKEYGEAGLEAYHKYRQDETGGELKKFHMMALKPEYRYLTKFGILQNWNFIGSCQSKGESQAPNAYLDMHSNTDIAYVVGCILGERARVGNIWGTRQHVKPGSKLFLILTRTRKGDNEFGHFQWIPYATCTRDYPPQHLLSYRDESGRMCRSFVLSVGVCTENLEKEPAVGQIERAMGMMGNAEHAFDAFGALPSIIIQIGI